MDRKGYEDRLKAERNETIQRRGACLLPVVLIHIVVRWLLMSPIAGEEGSNES